jgi:hypothetical protein
MNDIAPAPDYIERDWIKSSTEKFVEQVRSSSLDRLVWIAPQSACEQCGLQWYFEQFPDAQAGPMIILDWTLTPGWRDGPPIGLGELPTDIIAGLLDRAERRNWPQERASSEIWGRLRAEDTLLRVVEEGRLRSVEPDYFDALLLEHAHAEWCTWARVVGNTIYEAGERGHNIGDEYLLWRVREMIEQGRLECVGDLPGPEHDERYRPNAKLRLPGS